MAKSIHYELFVKRGRKGSWALADVFDRRDLALKSARAILDENPGFSVRVTKETLQEESGEFLSVSIFEEGREKAPPNKVTKTEAELPCFKPDDLYSYHAKTLIARLLEGFLARHQVTVSELMHRADLLEKLEATGTELQHAVQKYAIAHAGENDEPIHDVVRKVNDLVQQAVIMVYQTERARLFPTVTAGNFAKTAAAILKKGGGEFILCGGLAKFLTGAKGWDDKLQRLLGLFEHLPQEDQARDLCLEAVDRFVSEMLCGDAAITDLLGKQRDLGASLLIMTYLFLGRDDKLGDGTPAGVRILSQQFARGKLANSKSAIARRILSEIGGVRRLVPDSLDEEVKLVRKLANLLVMGQGPMLPAEDLAETFTVRSKRLVAPETVNEYLCQAELPHEKILRLLSLEENIVGSENKRKLAAYAMPIVTSHQCLTYFLDGDAPLLKRLAHVSEIQTAILTSGFQQENKQELAAALDDIAVQMTEKAGLFDNVDRQKLSPAGKAVALLRLCANGVLPKGECERRAKVQVIKYLQRPDFMKGVAEGSGEGTVDAAELKTLLKKTGVEDMMKATAA